MFVEARSIDTQLAQNFLKWGIYSKVTFEHEASLRSWIVEKNELGVGVAGMNFTRKLQNNFNC